MTPKEAIALPDRLNAKSATLVFLAFAAAYFCSALVRAITATLSPVLTQEFSLQAQRPGPAGGRLFPGFCRRPAAAGHWLDRHGPKRVILGFLSLAVLGCLAFSPASSFTGLLVARVLLGMGVSACLMAPLTGYRRWFDTASAAARQLVDADDRLARHGGLHPAGAVADAAASAGGPCSGVWRR